MLEELGLCFGAGGAGVLGEEAYEEAREAREAAREFLARELGRGGYEPSRGSWSVFDAEFSRRCGEAGLVGLCFPKRYGGGGKGVLSRHAVFEEMLSAGAPVGAHWVGDRQSGGQIVRYGSEAAKDKYLPGIIRGEIFFAIGMSEAGSGSDLAATRMRAIKEEGGWRLTGEKLWTTNGRLADYMITLARTGEAGETRRGGLTQFIVDLKGEGVERRGVEDMTGAEGFAQESLDGCFVGDEDVLGEVGGGWATLMDELASERSGPDRVLSSYRVLRELAEGGEGGDVGDVGDVEELGELAGRLSVLRWASWMVGCATAGGEDPSLRAALVKDMGTGFERDVVEASARRLGELVMSSEVMRRGLLASPSWTIRGGAREVLRGIVARGLGLR